MSKFLSDLSYAQTPGITHLRCVAVFLCLAAVPPTRSSVSTAGILPALRQMNIFNQIRKVSSQQTTVLNIGFFILFSLQASLSSCYTCYSSFKQKQVVIEETFNWEEIWCLKFINFFAKILYKCVTKRSAKWIHLSYELFLYFISMIYCKRVLRCLLMMIMPFLAKMKKSMSLSWT